MLKREIGAGEMATVFLAQDVRYHGIETPANLRHPRILPLFDSGQVGGTVGYVMSFVQGKPCRARLGRRAGATVTR